MKIPKIKCVKRTIESEGWKEGFVIYCIKFSNDKYSSDYGINNVIKEEIIYEGEFPKEYRILPYIDSKCLHPYCGSFISQRVPNKHNVEIASAIRGICGIQLFHPEAYIYDRQIYGKSGKIISSLDYKYDNDCDGVWEYKHSLLSDEDWKRIEAYEKLDEIEDYVECGKEQRQFIEEN